MIVLKIVIVGVFRLFWYGCVRHRAPLLPSLASSYPGAASLMRLTSSPS